MQNVKGRWAETPRLEALQLQEVATVARSREARSAPLRAAPPRRAVRPETVVTEEPAS